MKPPTFAGLGRVIARIHPPLERTPRQRKQLLQLLNRSFQDQLDKYHPPVNSDTDLLRSDANGEGKYNLSQVTNQHLQGVLSFQPGDSEIDSNRAFGDIAYDRLKRAVEYGTLTKDGAADCLSDYVEAFHARQSGSTLLLPDRSAAEAIVDIIDALKPRDRVRWLSSEHLMRPLLSQLIREGRGSKTWKWLNQIVVGDLAPQVVQIPQASMRVLLNLVGVITRRMAVTLLSQGNIDTLIEQCLMVPMVRLKGHPRAHRLTAVQDRIILRGIFSILHWVVYHGRFPRPIPARLGELLDVCHWEPRNSFYAHALLLYRPDQARASVHRLYELAQALRPRMSLILAERLGALLLDRILPLCDSETQANFFAEVFDEGYHRNVTQIRDSDPKSSQESTTDEDFEEHDFTIAPA